jgi:hypothetical protein
MVEFVRLSNDTLDSLPFSVVIRTFNLRGGMDITELISKVKQASNKTHEQRVILLQKAGIIGNDGYFLEKYFSEETVTNDRLFGTPVLL